jgi:plastocyanin
MCPTMSASRLGLFGLVVALASGCGGSDPVSADPVATTTVSVRDDLFVPPNIIVDPGATVTWTWSGSRPHRIRWVSAGLSDSPLQTNGTHQATMPQAPGTDAYFCTEHGSATAGMRGTVVVE